MTIEAEVGFRLRGDLFDPEAVNALLSLDYTSADIKGKGASFSHWTWSLKDTGFVDIASMASIVIEKLTPIQGKIMEAIERYDLTVDFWVEVDYEPGLHGEIPYRNFRFEPEILHFLSAVGATIYIDVNDAH